MKVKSSGVILAVLVMSNQAQSILDPKLPENYEDKIYETIKPLTDYIAPYKTHSGTVERGVPIIHDKLGKLFFHSSISFPF